MHLELLDSLILFCKGFFFSSYNTEELHHAWKGSLSNKVVGWGSASRAEYWAGFTAGTGVCGSFVSFYTGYKCFCEVVRFLGLDLDSGFPWFCWLPYAQKLIGKFNCVENKSRPRPFIPFLSFLPVKWNTLQCCKQGEEVWKFVWRQTIKEATVL
jgi:hypothetical protein